MARTELIGRERELAALMGHLASARAGRPRIVLCGGEPSIGKTRLAEEFAELAAAQGFVVVWGSAIESSGAPPHWPWRQALRGVSANVDIVAIAEALGVDIDLACFVPELFDTSPERYGSGSSEDRFRLFDAVARLLSEVCSRTPLVVVLDDAHRADDGSLQLLLHVTRVSNQQRLLVLVNYRIAEPVHEILVTGLPRVRATQRIHLGGLTLPAVGRQLTAIVGRDVSATDVQRVWTATAGNPFFVGEIGYLMVEGATLPVAISSSIRMTIEARIDQLSADSAQLLRIAAVVGREFAVDVISRMLGEPVLHCLSLLDEAATAGLVEPGPGPHEHRFVHVLVRDAIEASLGAAQRLRLHQLAANVVADVYADALEPRLSDVARHWAAAAVLGDRGVASGWISRAARAAVNRLAFEEGVRLYLWVPNSSSTSCDLEIFVDQSTEPIATSDVKLGR